MSPRCYTLSIKTRLNKLEQSFAVKAEQPFSYESSEETRQWLHDAVRSIKEGTASPLPAPRKSSGNSQETIAATKQWLAEMIIDIKVAKGTA